MKKIISFLLLFAICIYVMANDGAFYARGNQLIPITNHDISVKKEVLSITRYGNYAYIDVYYEFYNPKDAADVLMGFEAIAPSEYYDYYDEFANGYLPNSTHPYIKDFSVKINDQFIDYKEYIVNTDSGYYQNGQFSNYTEKDAEKYHRPLYVYAFTAHFEKGINIVQHRYRYQIGEQVELNYYLDYVLTAANRWANNQIDDFTLKIDMGDNRTFFIANDFFNSEKDWSVEGMGKMGTIHKGFDEWEHDRMDFHIQDGAAVFHKQNFHPNGELFLFEYGCLHYFWNNVNYEENDSEAQMIEKEKRAWSDMNTMTGTYLDFDKNAAFFIKTWESLDIRFSKKEAKILKNLPFAYRGYIFKDKTLQSFFESTKWYVKNPEYKGKMEDFDTGELLWYYYFESYE